jgi:hypothetical protein
MSNINKVSAEENQIAKKKTSGRPTKDVLVAEALRMREGVKKYVRDELAAGRHVCPILTKYVSELEMGHSA